MLDDCLSDLDRAFAVEDHYASHEAAAPVLLKMAAEPDVLRGIVARQIAMPDFSERLRHSPVIGLKVAERNGYTLVAHFWFPLPEGQEPLTHQSIHHHGNLLLSSASPLGAGYESILFEPGFEIDYESGRTSMKAAKFYRNRLHSLEFIGADTPHVVVFPEDLSVTYALWSRDRKYAADAVRGNKMLQKVKKPVRRLAKVIGLGGRVGINDVQYRDFHVQNGCCVAMKDRVLGYEPADNANFLRNMVHAMQQVGVEDGPEVEALSKRLQETENAAGQKFVADFRRGEAVADEFAAEHVAVDPRVNIPRSELLPAFGFDESPAPLN